MSFNRNLLSDGKVLSCSKQAACDPLAWHGDDCVYARPVIQPQRNNDEALAAYVEIRTDVPHAVFVIAMRGNLVQPSIPDMIETRSPGFRRWPTEGQVAASRARVRSAPALRVDLR